MRKLFFHFFESDEGASSVEYAVLASLIVGVIILVVSQLGISVRGLFQRLLDVWH